MILASLFRRLVAKQSRNMPCKYKSILAALVLATIMTTHSSCQTYPESDCKHQNQRAQFASRQQRQFNPKQANNPTIAPFNGQQQQQTKALMNAELQNSNSRPSSSPDMVVHQQEEFSLSNGLTNGNQQQQANYTLLPQQQVVNSIELPLMPSSQSTSLLSGPSGVGTREGSSESAAPSSSSNTTPPIPSDTIGSPVVLQPPATTTSSIPSSTASAPATSKATLPEQAGPAGNSTSASDSIQHHAQEGQPNKELHLHPSRQQQATGRRMEKSDDTIQRASHFSAAPLSNNVDQFHQARRDQELDPFQQTQSSHYQTSQAAAGASSGASNLANEIQQTSPINLAQPVSGSPLSISIITPLIGPVAQQQQHTATVSASIGTKDNAQQQQQQQQSMMKPILVLGNPISERDYSTNTLFYHQYPKEAATSSYSLQQATASETISTPAASQQPSKGAKGLDMVQHQINKQPDQQQQQLESQTSKAAQAKTTGPPNEELQLQHQQRQHQHSQLSHSSRMDKTAESNQASSDHELGVANSSSPMNLFNMDRMSGPPLVYSDGQLSSVSSGQQGAEATMNGINITQQTLAPPSPRHLQNGNGAAVLGNNLRRPSLPPPVSQANAASGFRSPLSPSGPLGSSQQLASGGGSLQAPANTVPTSIGVPNFYQNSPPYAGAAGLLAGSTGSVFNSGTPPVLSYSKPLQNGYMLAQASQSAANSISQQPAISQQQQQQQQTALTQQVTLGQPAASLPTGSTVPATTIGYSSRRPLNITRVEHISAECSDDLIRAVIVFNGTFKGIIYSSGYVNDPTCLYVNGTGSTRYEFSIRLNQCGTLGRQELHQPTIPGEARRRDQVMWNTLSIQYNSIIEQEWDEHFRVSCEYGSDFWKTVSFSPFNVETNTGSPVVFTINPPQCQMDVLLGHGMGPKIAVDGPVTVGDPLTLLIHMKSEKAGYDILVKNCVAHNGGKQRMQLIDSNGCVVNERFISPFRGTYNDNDLRHVTLYAYLKAFRFTGSPVLYLECEIHMCQSACPPQMCYWRRLSKRSVSDFDYEYTANNSLTQQGSSNSDPMSESDQPPVISESLSLFKALQVRQESEPSRARRQMRDIYAEDEQASLVCYRHKEVFIFTSIMGLLFLLVITIAITCTMRIRRLYRSSHQYKHNRFADSMSPSLLSIDGALSSAGSLFSNAALSNSLLSLSTGNKSCSAGANATDWQHFHPSHSHQHNRYQPQPHHHHHHHLHQQQLSKLSQPKPPIPLFQGNQRTRACHAAQVAVR